jgi:hypothetical protein
MDGSLAEMLIGSSVAGIVIVVCFALGVIWASRD